MINLMVSVAAFAGVKLAFLWMFDSERKRSTQVSPFTGKDSYLVESPERRFQSPSLLSGNRLRRSAGPRGLIYRSRAS